jgi:hypothetical protein
MVLNNTTQTHESDVPALRNSDEKEFIRNEESDRSKKTGFFAPPSSLMPGAASTRTNYVNGGSNSKTSHIQSEATPRGQCTKCMALTILIVVAILATISTYILTSNQERNDFEKNVRFLVNIPMQKDL